MDDSAPNEREIPHDIGAYQDNNDWYITRYTWQEYVLATVGGEKQTSVMGLPGYAYYVYIRVFTVDSSGVSPSEQSVYAFFCVEFPFCVLREMLLQFLKQHVRIYFWLVWWYGHGMLFHTGYTVPDTVPETMSSDSGSKPIIVAVVIVALVVILLIMIISVIVVKK